MIIFASSPPVYIEMLSERAYERKLFPSHFLALTADIDVKRKWVRNFPQSCKHFTHISYIMALVVCGKTNIDTIRSDFHQRHKTLEMKAGMGCHRTLRRVDNENRRDGIPETGRNEK
ncbi:hypothetical protein JTB14_035578 [Gonioctena quinquepunctata]|nr:hypothetical protein JTB14_035578 [Gonioctena quinquepunctata]